jgi:hypothetical protein
MSARARALSPTLQILGPWLHRKNGYLPCSELFSLELMWKSNFYSQSTGLALLLSKGCMVERRE